LEQESFVDLEVAEINCYLVMQIDFAEVEKKMD